MEMRYSKGNLLVLFFLVTCLCSFLHADEYAQAINDKGYTFWQDSNAATKLFDLSAAELVEKVRAVSEQPCSIDFCRTVLKDHPTKLAVEVAMDLDVPVEETGKPFGIVTRPVKSDRYATWRAYLEGLGGTDGSKDFQTSLLLKRKARIAKLNVFLKQQTGQPLSELSDDTLTQLKNDETFCWLLADVFEPVTIIFEPELKKKLGVSVSKQGPSFCKYPALNLLAGENAIGCLEEDNKLIIRRTDSCLFLGDVGDTMTVDKSIEEDSLGDIMGHEVFHSIMYDMMGKDSPGKSVSLSKVGHDAHVVSDYSLALSEGWAELFEAWSGIDNAAFDNRGGRSEVTRFILGRQVPIRRNKYVQADFEKFRNTKKRGKVKTGSQMVANEGLGAGLLYIVLTHDKIEDSFSLLLEAMYLHKPQNLCQMFEAMINTTDDGPTKRLLYMTFLHSTKFATVSGEARQLYQDSFKARLDYFEAKNTQADADEIAQLQAAREQTKSDYYDFIKPIINDVMAGNIKLDECLGPEIWLDKRDEDGKLVARRNLNTMTPYEMVMFDISGMGSKFIEEVRDKQGCIYSLDCLRGLGQEDMAILEQLVADFSGTKK